jgi:hypothetical protein
LACGQRARGRARHAWLARGLSYYGIVAGAPLVLWVRGRQDAARRAGFVIAVTFYVCYTLFLLFPVAGPRDAFSPPANALAGAVLATAVLALHPRARAD